MLLHADTSVKPPAADPQGYAVILTACVDPSTGSFTINRSDPAVRLNDYKQALKFWLALADPKIDRVVFLENSGYPLQEIADTVEANNPLNKRVELVSMRCNDAPPGTTYGYAELAMLDEGLPRSSLAASAKYWIKATGRLKFPGVSRLLRKLPDDYVLAVDTRDNTRFAKIPQRFVTTQLMVFSQAFYRQHLFGVKHDMFGELWLLEKLFYRDLMKLKGQPGVILRWPVNVDPVGQAAHWNKDYRSAKSRVLSAARAVARRVTPDWWV